MRDTGPPVPGPVAALAAFAVAQVIAGFCLILVIHPLSVVYYRLGTDAGPYGLLGMVIWVGFWGATLHGFLAFMGSWPIRRLNLPRPFADSLLGMLACGAAGLSLFFVEFSVSTNVTSFLLILSCVAAVLGALAGFAYWLFAGGPRSPYRPES